MLKNRRWHVDYPVLTSIIYWEGVIEKMRKRISERRKMIKDNPESFLNDLIKEWIEDDKALILKAKREIKKLQND